MNVLVIGSVAPGVSYTVDGEHSVHGVHVSYDLGHHSVVQSLVPAVHRDHNSGNLNDHGELEVVSEIGIILIILLLFSKKLHKKNPTCRKIS